MKRKQALELIGKTVHVWTSANGRYVGKLIEVTNDRPWRGKVQIESVFEVASFEASRGKYQRRGFRIGEVIEAGNSSITSHSDDFEVVTYKQALQNELEWLDTCKNPKDTWWVERSKVIRQEQIKTMN